MSCSKFFLSLSILHCLSTCFYSAPPLRIPLKVTGTLGEFRGDHFHAGLDLSTGGVTGQPVQAVADGILYRAKQVRWGEGKTLYLKHADGQISVYAHLEDFVPKLVEALPHSRSFDLFPKIQVAVNEGEIIGWAGESGRGLPHLHFEMREGMGIATDASMYLEGISDQRKPIIKRVFLVPYLLDRPLIKTGYPMRGSGMIRVNTPVGLAVEGFDLWKGSQAPCSIPEWKVYDNGNLIYHSKISKLNHQVKVLSSMHFLRDSTHLSPTRFVYKLYRDFVQASPYIQAESGWGVLSKGSHRLMVEAIDFRGNISRVKMQVRVESGEKPALFQHRGRHSVRKGDFKFQFPRGSFSSAGEPILKPWEMSWSVPDRILQGIELGPRFLFWLQDGILSYTGMRTGHEYFLRFNPASSKWMALKAMDGQEYPQTKIHLPGRYVIATDLSPPDFGDEIKLRWGLRKAQPYLRVDDKESGVDPASLRVVCDAHFMAADYDEDRKWISLPKLSCEKLRLSLCDQVGNCSDKTLLKVDTASIGSQG
jgi:hypothetical protein